MQCWVGNINHIFPKDNGLMELLWPQAIKTTTSGGNDNRIILK